MTPEQKLAALFAAEALPSRDHAFEARVAQTIALQRAWMTVAALVPWAVAAAAVLWALIPVVGPLGESLGPALRPAAGILAGAAVTTVAALWLSRRFGRGIPTPFSAR